MRKLTTTLSLFALAHAASAGATEVKQCVPPQKAEALLTYVLPNSLKAIGSKCSAALSADASLLQLDSEQFARYQFASEQAWPDAQDAIGLIAGEQLPEGVDMDLLRPMVDAMIPAMLVKDIKLKDCETIERVYNLLEPLPSTSLASLTVLLVQLRSKEEEKDRFNICKSPSE